MELVRSDKKRIAKVKKQAYYLAKNCSLAASIAIGAFDSWKSAVEKKNPNEKKLASFMFDLFLSNPIGSINFLKLAKNLNLPNRMEEAKTRNIMNHIETKLSFPINPRARLLSFLYGMDFKELFNKKVKEEITSAVAYPFSYGVNSSIDKTCDFAKRFGEVEFLKETVKLAIRNELADTKFFSLKNTGIMHKFADKLQLQEFLSKELNVYCFSLMYKGGSEESFLRNTNLFDALNHIYSRDIGELKESRKLEFLTNKLREMSKQICDFINDLEPEKAKLIKKRIEEYIDHEEYISQFKR